MARVAKRGAARYYRVSLRSEDEREVYLAQGESRLRPVAYFDADARADFSCVLGEGEHIAGWEIDGLRDWIHVRAALPDGSPVREVRVLFTYEHQARAERRPLLDAPAALAALLELTLRGPALSCYRRLGPAPPPRRIELTVEERGEAQPEVAVVGEGLEPLARCLRAMVARGYFSVEGDGAFRVRASFTPTGWDGTM